ncbi:hypothetical protein [Aeromonas phage 85AhydR10PP]|nr:hypothetical protein [Aeromonas phage 85AhydR10PP]
MTKQIKAQAEAAQQCLTILRDAGLIGDNLLTKLADTRTAILEVLGKMYQVCNKGEEATGESLERVRNTVTQLYGRAKWADHDAMMDMVEGALEHFIKEAKETTIEPTKVELTEEIKTVASNAIKGLTIRVAELTKEIEEMPEELGKEWLIVSALGTIAYEPFQGGLRPALRMEKALGFKGMLDAYAAAPHDVQVATRIDALKAVLHSSQEALSKIQEAMGGEA